MSNNTLAVHNVTLKDVEKIKELDLSKCEQIEGSDPIIYYTEMQDQKLLTLDDSLASYISKDQFECFPVVFPRKLCDLEKKCDIDNCFFFKIVEDTTDEIE